MVIEATLHRNRYQSNQHPLPPCLSVCLPPPPRIFQILGNNLVLIGNLSKMFATGSRENLSHEIIQKFEAVKESEHTARKKRIWCENIERNIRQQFPTSRLVLVGSSTSGFATEGCDVDLTLIRPERTALYGLSSDVHVLRRILDGLRTMRSINTEVMYRQGFARGL